MCHKEMQFSSPDEREKMKKFLRQTTIKWKSAEIERQDADDNKRNQYYFNFRSGLERHEKKEKHTRDDNQETGEK